MAKISAPEDYASRSVSVEAIDNGYLVTTSTSQNGEYKSERRFSASKPDISADMADDARAGRMPSPSSLADAISAIRGRR